MTEISVEARFAYFDDGMQHEKQSHVTAVTRRNASLTRRDWDKDSE